MAGTSTDIHSILALEAIKTLLSSDNVTLSQLSLAISIMVRLNIPFDIEFTPGNRRNSPSLELTIYITPNATLVITISLSGSGFGAVTDVV